MAFLKSIFSSQSLQPVVAVAPLVNGEEAPPPPYKEAGVVFSGFFQRMGRQVDLEEAAPSYSDPMQARVALLGPDAVQEEGKEEVEDGGGVQEAPARVRKRDMVRGAFATGAAGISTLFGGMTQTVGRAAGKIAIAGDELVKGMQGLVGAAPGQGISLDKDLSGYIQNMQSEAEKFATHFFPKAGPGTVRLFGVQLRDLMIEALSAVATQSSKKIFEMTAENKQRIDNAVMAKLMSVFLTQFEGMPAIWNAVPHQFELMGPFIERAVQAVASAEHDVHQFHNLSKEEPHDQLVAAAAERLKATVTALVNANHIVEATMIWRALNPEDAGQKRFVRELKLVILAKEQN